MTLQGTTVVSVKHNFETAHRLPFLGGKCQNLHGHSWHARIGLLNTHYPEGINEHGISIEYGLVKNVIRGWIDSHLDHGTMLGAQDTLAQFSFRTQLGKVFIFGSEFEGEYPAGSITGVYTELPWPTVEAVAKMLADKLQEALEQSCGSHIWIDTVEVRETAVNSSVYMPGFLRTMEKVDAADQ
jgi:6-pyruvoyltetrahydropterin/6-carboxytetrahydropterin synthase